MKKTILALSTCVFLLAACGGNSESTTTSSTSTPAPAAAPKSAMHPGELLIVKSDCIGCHHKENKIIGPSYLEVAEKYPATEENIQQLAKHIIEGSKGVWGNIPMTPHPKLSEQDAKSMVTYILSLKN